MNTKAWVPLFSLVERIGHWMLAISSLVLFLTGSGFLFFSLRWLNIIFAGKGAALAIHRLAGLFFTLSLLICFLAWIKECWPKGEDWAWIKSGRYVKRFYELPQEGRFNTVQKLYFFGVMFFAVASIWSGYKLCYPLSGSYQSLAWAYAIHTLAAIFLGITSIIHVYVRTMVNPGALTGITLGKVSRKWAQDNRKKWLERIEKERMDF